MYKLNKIIPNVVLGILLAITVVVCLLFYLGGNTEIPELPELLAPNYTDLLLNFTYFLFGLTILVTLVSVVWLFVSKLVADPKSSLVTIIGVGALALLLILTYNIGDTTPLNILGFEGEQTPGILKLTNMCINSSYILFGIAVIVSALSFLSKRIF
jgi:hypothetical protein